MMTRYFYMIQTYLSLLTTMTALFIFLRLSVSIQVCLPEKECRCQPNLQLFVVLSTCRGLDTKSKHSKERQKCRKDLENKRDWRRMVIEGIYDVVRNHPIFVSYKCRIELGATKTLSRLRAEISVAYRNGTQIRKAVAAGLRLRSQFLAVVMNLNADLFVGCRHGGSFYRLHKGSGIRHRYYMLSCVIGIPKDLIQAMSNIVNIRELLK